MEVGLEREPRREDKEYNQLKQKVGESVRNGREERKGRENAKAGRGGGGLIECGGTVRVRKKNIGSVEEGIKQGEDYKRLNEEEPERNYDRERKKVTEGNGSLIVGPPHTDMYWLNCVCKTLYNLIN